MPKPAKKSDLPSDLVFRTNRSVTKLGDDVEIAELPDGGAIIRSKGRPDALKFTAGEWKDFVAGVKNNEFDFL